MLIVMQRFKDVMSSGGSGSTRMVADLTDKIRMDDACNIQVLQITPIFFAVPNIF